MLAPPARAGTIKKPRQRKLAGLCNVSWVFPVPTLLAKPAAGKAETETRVLKKSPDHKAWAFYNLQSIRLVNSNLLLIIYYL